MKRDKALTEAIRKVGGLHALGRALGISHKAIMYWQKTPPRRVLDVERVSGVSRHDLRPDIYPIETDPVAKKVMADQQRELVKLRRKLGKAS